MKINSDKIDNTLIVPVTDCYMGLRKLSQYSDLSVSTLRNRLKEIPHENVGGKILVRRSDFDRWMEQHRVKVSGNFTEKSQGIVGGICRKLGLERP